MTNRHYFERRAEQERAAAVAARDPAVCRIHMQMAKEYEFRAATEPDEVELQFSSASVSSSPSRKALKTKHVLTTRPPHRATKPRAH